MDLEDVLKELQGLTKIEEMLIAQIFLVISVYCLYEGQYTTSGLAHRDFQVHYIKLA
ncbi:16976_t:CDS:2 [Cetraspora pellucida]|uniref:16976_t:CDS:1 n=1 Tax=Cetraspora pellucida TaxID=1433469 RepID=A0A9N9HKN6_9GLOM|nr:16976_t:CDS:2 [Cetraspora pellucida]